jgi:hypothetical protein
MAPFERFQRHRPRQQISLQGVAPARAQERALRLGFHPFGHGRQSQLVRQHHDRLHDRRTVRIGFHVLDESAVDFQRRQRQPLEVSQRRVAGAEIVEREFQPQRAQGAHALGGDRQVFGEHALGDLQLQARRIGAAVDQHRRHRFQEARVAQLLHADVDRQLDRTQHRIAGPARQRGAALLDHLQPERDDQAGVFEQADECARHAQRAVVAAPAHQALGADQRAGAIELRLAVQDEFAPLEAEAQLRFERGAPFGLGLHRRLEEARGVAAIGLGAVHGKVGFHQQGLHAGAVAVEQGDADAGRAARAVRAELERAAQGRQQAFGHGAGGADGVGA